LKSLDKPWFIKLERIVDSEWRGRNGQPLDRKIPNTDERIILRSGRIIKDFAKRILVYQCRSSLTGTAHGRSSRWW
jgi:hypothetical protein